MKKYTAEHILPAFFEVQNGYAHQSVYVGGKLVAQCRTTKEVVEAVEEWLQEQLTDIRRRKDFVATL